MRLLHAASVVVHRLDFLRQSSAHDGALTRDPRVMWLYTKATHCGRETFSAAPPLLWIWAAIDFALQTWQRERV